MSSAAYSSMAACRQQATAAEWFFIGFVAFAFSLVSRLCPAISPRLSCLLPLGRLKRHDKLVTAKIYLH